MNERWLTLKEAEAWLRDEHGIRTTWRNLERLIYKEGMPSVLNFRKRQVRGSEIIPWLREKGIIER